MVLFFVLTTSFYYRVGEQITAVASTPPPTPKKPYKDARALIRAM